MNGLVRKAALLGACGLFMAAAASAAVPDPAHSTVPAFIVAGGAQSNAGVPDPSIAFTITVRDFLNNPISGSNVEVNYSNCSDTKLCTAVVAGRTVDCTNRAVRSSTNAAGQVGLSILGGSTNQGTTVPPAIAAGAGAGCIRVYADGIQLATATSVVYDQNGSLVGGNGVNGLDLSIAKNDAGAAALGAAYRGRTDYTKDGSVNGADLAALKAVVGTSALGTGSGAGCAGNPGGVPQPYCP
jgi:hypothetical protein